MVVHYWKLKGGYMNLSLQQLTALSQSISFILVALVLRMSNLLHMINLEEIVHYMHAINEVIL